MKIKFTDSVAGANFAYRRGQVVDLRVDLALGFVKAGQAVRHEDPPAPLPEQVETAVAAAPENAAAGKRGRRKGVLGGLFPRG